MSIITAQLPETMSFALRPVMFKLIIQTYYLTTHMQVNITLGSKTYSWIQLPDPESDGLFTNFTFDLHEILLDFLSYQLQPINGGGIYEAAKSLVRFNVEFKALKISSSETNVTDTTGLLGLFDALNAGRQHLEDQNAKLYDINNPPLVGLKWLSNMPNESTDINPSNSKYIYKRIAPDESEYLSAYSSNLPGEATVTILKTNFDGSSDTATIGVGLAPTYRRWDVGVGPANINAVHPGFIDENVKTYAVYLHFGIPFSYARFYQIDRCCYTDATRIHFLNRLGGFDSVTFVDTERRKISAKRAIYQTDLPDIFAANNRGRAVQSVTASEEISCFSGPLRPAQKIWIEELLTSPVVYIQKNGQYIPALVRDGSFETKNLEKPTEILKVDLEYANPLLVQRN